MRTTAFLLVLCAAAAAQDLTHKAPAQKGPVALINATIHTVSGVTIDGGFVVFDEGEIVEVGKGERTFTATTRVIDAKGRHVYPGFFGAYTLLGLTEIGAVRASRDFDEVGAVTPEVRAAVAVNPDSTLLPVTRTNGVLIAASFPRGGLVPGRASVLRLDGWTWEDMAIRDSAGLVVTWPSVRPVRRRRIVVPDDEEKQRENIRKRMERIKETFAAARAYLAARKADPTTPADIRWEAMRSLFADGKEQRPVFFLAQEYDQIVSLVHFAAKEGLRAVVVGGRDAHLCTDLLKRYDVGVIISGIYRFPKRRDMPYDEMYRLPKRLEDAEVSWCLASGERTANERNLPYVAALAVAHGLDRAAAIRAMTLYPARIFGLEGSLGSIEAGKSATLIVTDGDPLEVTTNVERAFIDGREIDLSNKQTKLNEKYREKYRQLGLIPKK